MNVGAAGKVGWAVVRFEAGRNYTGEFTGQ
jgi:hypothetical protein